MSVSLRWFSVCRCRPPLQALFFAGLKIEQGLHSFDIWRLCQMMVEASRMGSAAVFSLAPTCQGNECCLLELRLAANLSGHGVAIHAGHADVQKYNCRPKHVHGLECRRIVSGPHLHAEKRNNMEKLSAASRLSSTTRTRRPVSAGMPVPLSRREMTAS